MPRTRPSELTISVTTRPQPPRRFTRRRNAVSVMPAIGASANGATTARPIRSSCDSAPIRASCHVSTPSTSAASDFDADGLADQIHRQHEPRVALLAHRAARRRPCSGPCVTSTIMPFADQRARIELQIALDQLADARRSRARESAPISPSNDTMLTTPVHFRTGSRSAASKRDEAVAGKERPVDLLLAILPAAPPRDRREERLEPLALELLPNDLLVARARPDGAPRRRVLHRLAFTGRCRPARAAMLLLVAPSSARRSSTR